MSGTTLNHLLAVSNNFKAGEPLLKLGGRVTAIGPNHFRASGLQNVATVDGRVEFEAGPVPRFGKIVQIADNEVNIVPYCNTDNIRIGDTVFIHEGRTLLPNTNWLGRVFNALGVPVDGMGPVVCSTEPNRFLQTCGKSTPALERERIVAGLKTGIRAIDIFTPVCYGQRLGIFAGSGVGKSTLLGMLAHADAFDCVVVAMVGERGREVREFLEDSLGKSALAKTVCIVATSDESALMRLTAPDLAMQTAEYFRSKNKRVLLLLDSITRYAHAIREVASASGELPVARGYPASVFAVLPKLLERAGAGTSGTGSITAFVTVLVDGDDHNDPIADAVRGILDGHVVLDRDIANQGRYPPVNLLSSLSRLAPRVWTGEQQKLVQQLKALISRFEDTRDLRLLGSWRPGEDELLDRAIVSVPLIYSGVAQSPSEPRSNDAFADLLAHMRRATSEGQNANQ